MRRSLLLGTVAWAALILIGGFANWGCRPSSRPESDSSPQTVMAPADVAAEDPGLPAQNDLSGQPPAEINRRASSPLPTDQAGGRTPQAVGKAGRTSGKDATAGGPAEEAVLGLSPGQAAGKGPGGDAANAGVAAQGNSQSPAGERPHVVQGWIVPEEPGAEVTPPDTIPMSGRERPIVPTSSDSAAPASGAEAATPAEGATGTEPLPNPLRGGTRPTGELPEVRPGGATPAVPPGSAPAPQIAPAVVPGPSPDKAGQSQGGVTPPQATTAGSTSKAQRLERPPFDPIKENGEFFVGWTKPQLALVFTGRQDGYFEPCGCAGKERMKGGLSRRHTMVKQLREQGWPLVVMDVGGLIKGFGKQTEVKFQVTVDALRKIGYDAINLGKNDLRLPVPLLLSVIAPTTDQPSEFVSANVALFDFAADQWTSRYRIVQAGGKRVGITAILGKSYYEEIHNPDLAYMEPAEALAKIVPELKSKADILVLLAYAPDEETLPLMKQFPELTVLASSDGPAEPPAGPQFVPGTKTMLVHVGEKGMAAIVLGLYDNPDQPIAYQRVILDSRYPDSPEMYQVMVTYQAQLQALGLEGLEIRAVAHPRREVQGDFVGSEKCANCHEKSYLVWKKSGHSKAWETLANLDPPRTYDPECISCHVTGWHPTRYFPYLSGFISEEQTPHLVSVGCESCHGPGGEHVAAEMGSDIERQLRAAQALVVTKEQAETSEAHNCRNCHDLDNSPDFHFPTYWPLVEHYETE